MAAPQPRRHLPVLVVRGLVVAAGGDPVTRLRAVGRWLYGHAAALALLVSMGSIAFGMYSGQQAAEARQDSTKAIAEAATTAARQYVLVLRDSCNDRNVRDGKVLAAIRTIADAGGATSEQIQPLAEALSARDCEAIYPLPKPGQAGPIRRRTPGVRQPFDSCETARKAGLTPLRKGDPGYSTKLDADGDGIACE